MKRVVIAALFAVVACGSSGPGDEGAARLSEAYTPPSGTDLTPSGTAIALITMPTGGGNLSLSVIHDGVFPAVGSTDSSKQYDTYTGATSRPEDWLGYSFSSSQVFGSLVFQDGKQFSNGGWFASIQVEVRQFGTWSPIPGWTVNPTYAGHDGVNFETYVFSFPPVVGDGVRVDGAPGGSNVFISCGELRVYGPPPVADASSDATVDAPVDSSLDVVESSSDATDATNATDATDASEASTDSGPLDDGAATPDVDAAGEASSGGGGGGSDGNQSLPCITTPPGAAPAPSWNGPALVPGIWTNITPTTGVTYSLTPPPYGNAWITLDPTTPTTLYTTGDSGGLMKTTNAGLSWSRIQPFDNPTDVLVDWANPQHLYVSEGVHGNYLGFWVTEDGGQTWNYPPGFAALGDNDVTDMETDPADFCHVLLSSHSLGRVYESNDGGNTWATHTNGGQWSVGSKAVHFLHDPAHNQGNASTLLVIDTAASWRSTDDGASWTSVYSAQGTLHAGMEFYYASNGTLYTGGPNYPIRSTDNGLTWTGLTSLGQLSYYAVVGTGTTLFTSVSSTGTNQRTTQSGAQSYFPYQTSPESDGLNWTPYTSGQPTYPGGPIGSVVEQTFADGPFRMVYDASNHVMYSANWDAGLWALSLP